MVERNVTAHHWVTRWFVGPELAGRPAPSTAMAESNVVSRWILAGAVAVGGFTALGWWRARQRQRRYRSLDELEAEGEFDFIIIGGGSAGCACLHTLSGNRDYTVLLVEAGQDDNDEPLVQIPLACGKLQQGELDYKYQSTPQQNSSLGFRDCRRLKPRAGFSLF